MGIEDSVAPASEAAAGAVSAGVRSVQETRNVWSQRSKGGVGAHQEKEDEVAVGAPVLCGPE